LTCDPTGAVVERREHDEAATFGVNRLPFYERGRVESSAEPDTFDATATDVVGQADERVFVADTDDLGPEHVGVGPGVPVCEPHLSESNTRRRRHGDPLDTEVREGGLDAAVVVALDECRRNRQRLHERGEFRPLLSPWLADTRQEVTEYDQPVGVGLVDEFEQALAPPVGPVREFDPIAPELPLDAGVVVRDHECSLASKGCRRRRHTRNRLDSRGHQIGFSDRSSGS